MATGYHHIDHASRIEEIRWCIAHYQTRREIAAHLGYADHTLGNLQAWLLRHGHPSLPVTPRALRKLKVDRVQVDALLALGHTLARIATMLGVSRSAIERGCARWGLQTSRRGPRGGSLHPEWEGGRCLDQDGYVLIYVPLHPQARRGGGRLGEHRLLAEVVQGRYLSPREVVHHLDEVPHHNWPDNLQVFACNADHLRHELSGKWCASQRESVSCVGPNHQTIARCPSRDDTQSQCPEEIRVRLAWYIESFHPTLAHRTAPLRSFLGSGAWRDPFQPGSTSPDTGCRQ